MPIHLEDCRSKHLLKEMYIADELLKHDLDGKPSVDIPSCPVLVFVDIKDEKLGGRLYNEFCCRLNKKTGNWQMIQFYGKRVTIDHHLTFPNMLSLMCWERWSCKYFGMDVVAEDDVTFFLVAHEMKGVCVCVDLSLKVPLPSTVFYLVLKIFK